MTKQKRPPTFTEEYQRYRRAADAYRRTGDETNARICEEKAELMRLSYNRGRYDALAEVKKPQ